MLGMNGYYHGQGQNMVNNNPQYGQIPAGQGVTGGNGQQAVVQAVDESLSSLLQTDKEQQYERGFDFILVFHTTIALEH